MTYAEAKVKFKKCRNKENGYRLTSNTRIQQRGNSFAINLLGTDVVVIREDGTYRLNSGGWRTVTTKAAMCSILPQPIYQSMGIWYLAKIPYYDGMLIGSDGIPIGECKMDNIKKIKQKVDRKFTKFLNIMFETLVGGYLIGWKSKVTVPEITNKTYAKKLWAMVTEVLEMNTRYRSRNKQVKSNVWNGKFDDSERNRLILLSIFSQKYPIPSSIWNMISNDLYNGEISDHGKMVVRFFFRRRKVIIAEMIANGEIE